MDRNRRELDDALALLEARLPLMLRQYAAADTFAAVFAKATGVIESEAGSDVAYARRSIDRLLARQIKASH
ncbi:MAG: hypothetical protein ABIO38_02360 [Luteimonas sp.]